jgi:hypothetical protein
VAHRHRLMILPEVFLDTCSRAVAFASALVKPISSAQLWPFVPEPPQLV